MYSITTWKKLIPVKPKTKATIGLSVANTTLVDKETFGKSKTITYQTTFKLMLYPLIGLIKNFVINPRTKKAALNNPTWTKQSKYLLSL